jgi:hypothetical protein
VHQHSAAASGKKRRDYEMSAINYYKTPARDKILSSRGDIIFANKSQVSLRLRGGSYNNTCNWPFYNASPGFSHRHESGFRNRASEYAFSCVLRWELRADGQFLGKFKRNGERHFKSHDLIAL